ncbi:MAG: methylenetetrahydrofolate reductase [NAD(P)H] [Oscillospiraceae bacterium]|nr:methylenetetrahydrofolate reductase [NAD(P)H] [Oscillospiraceae bacterium]
MKISELFKEKTVLSFEIFPPKPTTDESVIYETLNGLTGLHPDFISVTYGAGGGKNGSKTIQIASAVKNRYGIESVAHLPCIGITKKQAVQILDSLKGNGIENILALRGDISPDTVPAGDFSHANELIEFIRERYDFNIIAACYPEVHSESKNIVEDINYLKQKVYCGVSHLITQLFLDNDYFYAFRERTAIAGINVPIEAGIMPVTNKVQIERMVKLCGIHLPNKFMKMIERYENNPEALRDAGIAYAIDQIVDLISQGVDGIHLYTMNNPYVAKRIYKAVHSLLAVQHC